MTKPTEAKPALTKDVDLVPVFEFQNDSKYFVRISKVLERPEPGKALDDQRNE